MAHVGVAEAARMTGRDPSTIFRALRRGRLSYSKDAAGSRKIDVAELQRVFPIDNAPDQTLADVGNGAIRAPARARTQAPHGEVEALRLLVAAKDEALRDLRARVDAIEARLDASEAERRQLSERLHGLLTRLPVGTASSDQPAAEGTSPASYANQGSPATRGSVPLVPASAVIPHPPWWRRWFR